MMTNHNSSSEARTWPALIILTGRRELPAKSQLQPRPPNFRGAAAAAERVSILARSRGADSSAARRCGFPTISPLFLGRISTLASAPPAPGFRSFTPLLSRYYTCFFFVAVIGFFLSLASLDVECGWPLIFYSRWWHRIQELGMLLFGYQLLVTEVELIVDGLVGNWIGQGNHYGHLTLGLGP